MKVITIIPARANSKSIRNKNIKQFNGFPLIKYSIDYSIKSSLVNRTIVSTESQKIANIALKYGAEVPFLRPKKLALDYVQDYPVIKHALLKIEKLYDEKFDIIILLRPTSPLRPSNLIKNSINLLKKNPQATSVRAVTIANQHPFRQWIQDEEYIYTYHHKKFLGKKENYNLPRQKLPKSYWQTGDIETIRRSTIIKGSISGNKILPLIIRNDQVLDIDSLSDFKKAMSKLK